MDVSSLTNAYNEYYTGLAGNASTEALKGKLNAADKGQASDDELMDVCKQFESYLLEQVFKNMQKTVMKDDTEGSASTSNLVDFFQDRTIQELASQSTEKSPLGIAQMLYDQLKVNMGIDPSQIPEVAAQEGKVAGTEQ